MRKIACVCFVFLAACVAFAAHVTGPAVPTPNVDGGCTYTYNVKPESDATGAFEQIKDFHLWWVDPTNPNKTKKLQGTLGGGPQNWTSSQNSQRHPGSANWGSGTTGSAIPKDGTGPTPFTITLTKSQNEKLKDALVYWQCTGDGNKEPDAPPGLDTGPGEDRENPPVPDQAIHAPVCYSDVTGPGTAGKGTMCAITIDSSQMTSAYRVFAVSQPQEPTTPDPLKDYAGFVSWCDNNPADSSLTFTGLTGNTNGQGNSNEPTVTIPNDPSLVGTKFYLIVVTDDPRQGGGIDKIAGDAKEVTITE